MSGSIRPLKSPHGKRCSAPSASIGPDVRKRFVERTRHRIGAAAGRSPGQGDTWQRRRGIRIGEAPDRDGRHFHYLSMWLYALAVLGQCKPLFTQRGVALVRQIHDAFVIPRRGVVWKMREDLSAPYPGFGFGFGALDAFDGYVAYRLLDPRALPREIDDMRALNTFFDGYRSGDEYDREAITHVMACSSHFPGLLLADNLDVRSPGSPPG